MIPETGKIYEGDALEIMRTWPDKCVDLVLTDPPYGMNYFSNHYKDGNPHSEIAGDSSFPHEAVKEFFRIARGGVFCFMRWNNLQELKKEPKSFIVWAKNNWSAGDLEHEYGRQWEGCAFWPLENHAFIGRPSDVIDARRVPSTELQHPTEKPVYLLEEILRHNIGQIICDPYCGSGSTLLAAERLGRKWIGIEIEPKYCAIAQARVDAERAQLKLFP